MIAKPFLKWAGGKTQLLPQLREFYPKEIDTYIEPFIGGGAVLFDIMEKYKPKNVHISDINNDLVKVYIRIRDDLKLLLNYLEAISNKYLNSTLVDMEKYYYEIRETFNCYKNQNGRQNDEIWDAAAFIFLNKTCFNGLCRYNSKGIFNTPSGHYQNPKIFDKEILLSISRILKDVNIKCCNFNKYEQDWDENTFVYLDPPYRPISNTSSFTAYTKSKFNDDNQIELREFCGDIANHNAKFMLSNSKTDDGFIEEHYKGFNIHEVLAKRSINSNGEGRGKIKEVLITNY